MKNDKPIVIDYCDVLVAKDGSKNSSMQTTLERINKICKDHNLSVLVVDEKLTRKTKKVCLKELNNES